VGLHTGSVLRNVGFVREKPKMRRDETECHQSDAGADPRKKRSLFGEIVPQISP
jgi:hypothetical protein